jgi:hypothetical protein
MKKFGFSFITKLLIIIASLAFVPNVSYNQDKGAKTVKSGGAKKSRSKGIGTSYSSRKRSGKKHWNNQDKETRKRMKRAARNAKRRQKGKPMKNNRLV